jgi:hypothetical protein
MYASGLSIRGSVCLGLTVWCRVRQYRGRLSMVFAVKNCGADYLSGRLYPIASPTFNNPTNQQPNTIT